MPDLLVDHSIYRYNILNGKSYILKYSVCDMMQLQDVDINHSSTHVVVT
jgi:hypothetical protein